MNEDTVGGLVFLGFGLFATLGGLARCVESIRLVSRGVRTRGTVIDYLSDCEEGSYLIVMFNDQGGNAHHSKLDVSGGRGGPSVGESIVIFYDPADPSEVSHGSFGMLWVFPLAILGFGVLSAVVGIMVLLGLWELTSGP